MPDDLTQLSPEVLAVIRNQLQGVPPALQTTMPPQPVQEAMKGMVEPITNAGWLLGGAMQGSQRPSTMDVVKAAGGLGLAALPMGPGRAAGAVARGAEAAAGSVAKGAARTAEAIPDYITAEGLAIKGKPFTKAAKVAQGEVMAAPKGAGPMDLSSVEGVPGIDQAALERYTPPRGASPRIIDALKNPDVISGVKESIGQGVEMGAHKWYHTEPIRQAFADEYKGSNSDPGGARAFKSYMDLVAATSPRSDVPTNIRNASYYHMLKQQGKELPESLPYPYGHVAQNLHRQNFNTLGAAGVEGGGWDVLRNPKPASFAENLTGNLEPVTVDTHAFRNIGMRTKDPRFLETSISQPLKGEIDPQTETMINKYGEIKGDKVVFRPQQLYREGKLTMEDAQKLPVFWASKPNENEYAAAENFYRQLAKEHGLAPADAQAAAWAGAGKLTGLGTVPDKTFPEMLNERVAYTAKMRNEDPKKTMSMFIRGQKPLLTTGGLIAAASGAAPLSKREQ